MPRPLRRPRTGGRLAEEACGPGREVEVEVVEAEELEHLQREPQAFRDLVGDVFLTDEQVPVVHREATHPQKSVEHARSLISIDRAELRVPNRQLPVRAQTGPIDRRVKGAIHRFDEVALPVQLHPAEEILLVVREVSRGLEELLAREMRRVDQLVPPPDVLLSDDVLDLVAQERALRVPKDEPRPDQIVEREEIELLAEHAVVALLGLLDAIEELLELGL